MKYILLENIAIVIGYIYIYKRAFTAGLANGKCKHILAFRPNLSQQSEL